MPVPEVAKIWMDGEMVDWHDAKIHILTPTLHYGWGVFEGIRAYPTDRGPAVFQHRAHMERLHRSARILQMEVPYSVDELMYTPAALAPVGIMFAPMRCHELTFARTPLRRPSSPR